MKRKRKRKKEGERERRRKTRIKFRVGTSKMVDVLTVNSFNRRNL